MHRQRLQARMVADAVLDSKGFEKRWPDPYGASARRAERSEDEEDQEPPFGSPSASRDAGEPLSGAYESGEDEDWLEESRKLWAGGEGT